MLFKRSNLSLSNEYFLFVFIALISLCILSAGFCSYSYFLYKEQKQESLLRLTKLLYSELISIFEENENILKFFGSNISYKFDYKDLNSISKLLTSSINLNVNSMTKSYISWANPEGKIIVSGLTGILQNNQPTIDHRSYFNVAKQKSWTLQIAEPDTCLFESSENILPTTMGIKKDKQFIGYLVLGLHIDYIDKKLRDMLVEEKINYVVINSNLNPIFSSSITLKNKKLINTNQEQLFKCISAISDINKISTTKCNINQNQYLYITKISKYPLFMLTGFESISYKQNFLNIVTSRLLEFFFLGIFCITLLYFFRKKIILPITTLANLAFNISNGNLDIKIPKQNSVEMFSLAKSLLLVIKYIKKNELYKQKLELANKIAKESDYEKADFIKKIRYEFSAYLKEIFLYSHVINKHFQNTFIANDKIIQYTKKIKELITAVNNKTSNFLELKYFDLVTIIEQAIKVNMKLSFMKSINIIKDFQLHMPNILADELRIKQILISLLRQSIENSPIDSNIFIKANTFTNNEKTWFQIILKDQNFGLDDDCIQVMEEKFKDFADPNPIMLEFTIMKIKDIEKIVLMHEGRLQVENNLYNSKKIRILLPLNLTNEYTGKDSLDC